MRRVHCGDLEQRHKETSRFFDAMKLFLGHLCGVQVECLAIGP